MIGVIRAWVRSRPLREARKARAAALAMVADAERRNDTRDLGRARMIAAEATRRELRLTVGR